MEIAIQDVEDMLTISDIVFNKSFNEPLIHQVVISYLSGKRQGSKAQKSRAEVSGSGKKPWRQKGTGRARAGSLRSPIWRSGGVTFASKLRNYKYKINKKMYQGALKSILSELIRQNRFLIFKNFSIKLPKTKILLNYLKKINLNNVLIIMDDISPNLVYAAKNLYQVHVLHTSRINPVILLTYENVITTVSAVQKIEGFFL